MCHKFKRFQIKQNLLNHKTPKGPFIKIGMDIVEYRGTSYLIVVDYYSRWLEIKKINHKDAMTIVSKKNLKNTCVLKIGTFHPLLWK